MKVTANDILKFWFEDHGEEHWFQKDPVFDRAIEERFGACLAAAARGELFGWRTGAQERLAEIIVLDQFSRNIHRGKQAAFAQDAMALTLAQELVAQGLDQELEPVRRGFAYLPYMHSESPLIHEEAMRLYEELGDATSLDYEIRHKVIIDRFGRYPHRNEILERESTPEELQFLKENPGF